MAEWVQGALQQVVLNCPVGNTLGSCLCTQSEKSFCKHYTKCILTSAGHTYLSSKISSWKWWKRWLQSAQILLLAQSPAAVQLWSLKFPPWKERSGLRRDNTMTWAVASSLRSRRTSIAQARIPSIPCGTEPLLQIWNFRMSLSESRYLCCPIRVSFRSMVHEHVPDHIILICQWGRGHWNIDFSANRCNTSLCGLCEDRLIIV